jgi:serine-type D-Ala-D-Ala carboxypeptidase/endopeptidase
MSHSIACRDLSRVFACIVTLFVACLPRANAADLQQQIDTLAKPLIADGTAVGFVVGVTRDGKTLFLSYGETVKGSRAAPNPDTVYEIGSVTKVFTATLLADMVERGLVKLNDPVQQYLPGDVKMPVADGKPIRLLDLATQSSGLPRMPDNLTPSNPLNPYADYEERQLFAFLNGHKLRRPPGTYEYSNLGMGVLGVVLARRAGSTYEQLLSDRITEPLGLGDTRISLDDRMRYRLAPPYNAAGEPERNWDFGAFAGAGAVRSTARDLLKFAQANLADDGPLHNAFHLAQKKHRDTVGGPAMGLGWHFARDGITRAHSGMTGGYHTYLAIVPSRGIGVVVVSNTATERISVFGDLVTRAAFGLEVEPLPPRKPQSEHKTMAVDAAILARYVGVYPLFAGLDLTVSLDKGQLMVQATGQPKLPVFAESPTRFFYKAVDAQITFVLNKDGKVEKLVLHQNGKDLEGMRTVAVDKATLARYVGVYPLFAGFNLTVSEEDGQLMVQGTGQPKLPVFAKSPTEFFYKGLDAQITFVLDKDGKVEKLVLRAEGTRTAAVEAATLARYAGVYQLLPGFDLTVSVEEGQLMVQGTGQAKVPVFAESQTKFSYKVVDAQITFVPDKDGNVNTLTLHQNGANLSAKRKK